MIAGTAALIAAAALTWYFLVLGNPELPIGPFATEADCKAWRAMTAKQLGSTSECRQLSGR